MSSQKTKGRNQAIDGFAHGVSAAAEALEIPRGGDSYLRTASFEQLEMIDFAEDASERVLVVDPLQDLAKNQVRESKGLSPSFAVEVFGFIIPCTPQVVDPNRGVDNDHG